jgi:gentisate 1,2-dioxygenase
MTQGDNRAQRAALTEEADKLHLVEFWTSIKQLEVTDPDRVGEPFVWHFEEVVPRLKRAAVIVPVEEADRRAVVFRNPGLGGRIATTPSLYAAYSLYNPGEQASVHRHSINAARIGLFGSGGYTTVDGIKYMVGRGDLVLTPNWSWHDHGNDGGEQSIWFDILDVPLVMSMNTRFFDFDYREEETPGVTRNRRIQSPRKVVDPATNPLRAAGVKPMTLPRGEAASRVLFYSYAESRRSLALAAHDGCDPFDGVVVRLTNPATGGFAMSTIDCTLKLLPAGARTQPMRLSAHSIFLVMEGRGYTDVAGKRLDWQENDVFVVPNWMWHHHVNLAADGDAVLYAMSDEPLVRNIEGWRRQGRREDGAVVALD